RGGAAFRGGAWPPGAVEAPPRASHRLRCRRRHRRQPAHGLHSGRGHDAPSCSSAATCRARGYRGKRRHRAPGSRLREPRGARAPGYLEGRCLSFGSAIPYAPVLDLVRTQCGLSDPDTPEVIAAKVRAELAKLGMDGANLAPYLLHLLGLKEEADVLGGLSPE